uniref:Uncharacterized protein n=1 Tax=Setaria italica TaxID=4555 RepID=K3Z1B3_SETIT
MLCGLIGCSIRLRALSYFSVGLVSISWEGFRGKDLDRVSLTTLFSGMDLVDGF